MPKKEKKGSKGKGVQKFSEHGDTPETGRRASGSKKGPDPGATFFDASESSVLCDNPSQQSCGAIASIEPHCHTCSHSPHQILQHCPGKRRRHRQLLRRHRLANPPKVEGVGVGVGGARGGESRLAMGLLRPRAMGVE